MTGHPHGPIGLTASARFSSYAVIFSAQYASCWLFSSLNTSSASAISCAWRASISLRSLTASCICRGGSRQVRGELTQAERHGNPSHNRKGECHRHSLPAVTLRGRGIVTLQRILDEVWFGDVFAVLASAEFRALERPRRRRSMTVVTCAAQIAGNMNHMR